MTADNEVTCPRCGSTSIYYEDVVIRIDYDYLAWDDEKIVWNQDTHDEDYCDLPEDMPAEYRDGVIRCHNSSCRAWWANLDTLNREACAEKLAEIELSIAEEQQFGEAGNYAGLEAY